MVEIKIFNDGELRKTCEGELLLFSLLSEHGAEALKSEAGVVGEAKLSSSLIQAFARNCADLLVSLQRNNKRLAIVGGEVFRRAFEARIKEIVFGGGQ